MDYISVAEGRKASGLRLVLNAGAPGPWSIAARALFSLREVPFVPVAQDFGGPNEDLVAWTGQRNAPVAVYENEPPVHNWLDIIMLAERLGRGPSLIPDDPLDRALALGVSAEICGRDGFGWSRRLSMMAVLAPPKDGEPPPEVHLQYGVRPDAIRHAPKRTVDILRGLSRRLHDQRARGSDYLVGSRLSACDVHWACFSIIVRPLPPEAYSLRPDLHAMFVTNLHTMVCDEERAAIDPILTEHRDLIWTRHIGLPLVC